MELFAFILIQFCWIIKAWFNAGEEAAFTWPFRMFGEANGFAEKDKKQQLNIAHDSGAADVAAMLVLTGGLYAMLHAGASGWMLLKHGAIGGVISGCWYMLLFNTRYALKIGKGLFYLGEYADSDNWLRKVFKKNAGVITYLILALGIAGLNWLSGVW